MSSRDYLSFLAPQWHDLMFKFDVKYNRHFRRIAGALFLNLAKKWPELTYELFTMPIIQPLFEIEITLKQFRKSLERIYNLFVESTVPNCILMSQLPYEVFEIMFEVFSKSQKSLSTEENNWLKEILKFYLQMKPSNELLQFFKNLLVDSILKEKKINQIINKNQSESSEDKVFIYNKDKQNSHDSDDEKISIENVSFQKFILFGRIFFI